LPRVKQVMKQTRARIHRGDPRSEDKLLSVFEHSTEIIRKGKWGKLNEFGKMVKLQEAENQIVIDFEVYDRRPSDSDLLVPAIDAHQAAVGRVPYLLAADAAFYSRKTRLRQDPRASSASASPTVPPRVPSADTSKRSAGSATARNGAPDVRVASA
jgi:IS5 family transposase